MKTKIIILIGLLLATTSFTLGDENSNPGEFTVVKEESGIRISEKWIPVTSTRSARQVRCEFTVEGSVASVISVLHDDLSFTKWMKGTKTYYRVKTIDPGHWYSYVQFHLPWPLHNQDCIIRYEVSTDAADGKTVIRMTGDPGFLKQFEDVTRIPNMEGSWKFTDLGNNRVGVEYRMFTNQAPKFPRWITDPIVHSNLLKTMDAFRSNVHKRGSETIAQNESH
ncbi:MAG: hypothetical protein NTU98_14540 [Bacteroidetes bacterium]|nr:hypothetical protein [Bacteroidota bacterium]